jgi:hypothetical protein
MAVRSTLLSTILARMQRYQDVLQNNNEVFQVRDLDESIRALRRIIPLPWTIQKGSLRVFDNVQEYAVPTDHDELAYLDTSEDVAYPSRARFRYTSLKQFYEDPDNRNQIAEIWKGNQRTLGVNYKDMPNSSQTLNNAETVSDWTVTGDAASPTLDQVFFKDGNGSIRVLVTLSTAVAGIRNSLSSSLSDTEYKKKYQFKWVYLTAAPTSIELRLETDASNYLYTVLTTQFDGTPFAAGQWNMIAQDLNTATEFGTFDSTSIAYERVVLNDAASGYYYVDASYLREWKLLDYWYYSTYQIIAVGGTVASKEYFYNDSTSPAYDVNDAIVGDSEWIDCIMYDAILNNEIDIKASKEVKDEFRTKRGAAWQALMDKYPSLDPVMITNNYRFVDDFIAPSGMATL